MPAEFHFQNNKPTFLTQILAEPEYEFYKAVINPENANECFCAFVCRIENEQKLEDLWRKITNLIGSYYQVEQESEFSRWNIYLLFFVGTEVSKRIKYAIENDPAFVRKLVYDKQSPDLTKENILAKLNQQILGSDVSALVDKRAPMAVPPVISSIGQNLFEVGLGISRSASDSELRSHWLDKKLQELGQ